MKINNRLRDILRASGFNDSYIEHNKERFTKIAISIIDDVAKSMKDTHLQNVVKGKTFGMYDYEKEFLFIVAPNPTIFKKFASEYPEYATVHIMNGDSLRGHRGGKVKFVGDWVYMHDIQNIILNIKLMGAEIVN